MTTNLSLAKIPENSSQFYILPESQTLNKSSSGSTDAYISVLVESNATPFNDLRLVDINGKNLNATLIGTLTNTEPYAVNSYMVTIPNNISMQQIQVNSYNNSTAICTSSCSNVATINLVQANFGILQVQPYSFSMSPTYLTQVVTLTNTGNASLSGSLPSFSAPFSITNNTCGNTYTLAPSVKCSFTLNYTVTSSSGQSSFVFSYNNNQQVVLTVPYTGITQSTVYAYL